jgi:hypothetical protein
MGDLIHGRDYAQASGCRVVGLTLGLWTGLPCTQ